MLQFSSRTKVKVEVRNTRANNWGKWTEAAIDSNNNNNTVERGTASNTGTTTTWHSVTLMAYCIVSRHPWTWTWHCRIGIDIGFGFGFDIDNVENEIGTDIGTATGVGTAVDWYLLSFGIGGVDAGFHQPPMMPSSKTKQRILLGVSKPTTSKLHHHSTVHDVHRMGVASEWSHLGLVGVERTFFVLLV